MNEHPGLVGVLELEEIRASKSADLVDQYGLASHTLYWKGKGLGTCTKEHRLYIIKCRCGLYQVAV